MPNPPNFAVRKLWFSGKYLPVCPAFRGILGPNLPVGIPILSESSGKPVTTEIGVDAKPRPVV